MPVATVVGVREIGPEHELRLVLRHPHLQRLAEVRESARVGVVSTRGNSDISGGIKNYAVLHGGNGGHVVAQGDLTTHGKANLSQ